MNLALTLLLSVWTALLPPESDPTRARNIIRDQTDTQGVVDDALAERTGWRIARGFHWQILLRGTDGRFRAARADGDFVTGQAFRLELEAENDLWIYLLNRAPDGSEVVLLPEKGEEHLLVRKGERVVIPPTGQFRFDDPPGVETFRILASPEKLGWVNPHELFRWESGVVLDPDRTELARSQKRLRSKAIEEVRRRQSELNRLDRPLSQVVPGFGAGPAMRELAKDTVVVAPLPEEGSSEGARPTREQVVRVSPDRRSRDPLVYDIHLRHRHPVR